MTIEEDMEYGFTKCNSQVLPRFCQFETGTACNVKPNCFMCPHSKMGRSGSAKWSTLIKVIEEIIPYTDACSPFLMQEPLLEPRLIPLLNDIKYTSPSTTISLYTNMALMTEEMAEAILKTRAVGSVSMSFYGPTEELYNKWQPSLDWEQTKENIRRFGRMRNATGRKRPQIELHYLCVKELMYWWPEIYATWQPHVDRICIVPFDTFHGDIPNMGFPEFFNLFHDESTEKSKNPMNYLDDPEKRAPCKRLWNTMSIHFNGDIVPCCIDYQGEMPMGNINKENAKLIWHNDKFNDLRRLHLERRFDEIPMCKNCTVWQYTGDDKWQKKWTE